MSCLSLGECTAKAFCSQALAQHGHSLALYINRRSMILGVGKCCINMYLLII